MLAQCPPLRAFAAIAASPTLLGCLLAIPSRYRAPLSRQGEVLAVPPVPLCLAGAGWPYRLASPLPVIHYLRMAHCAVNKKMMLIELSLSRMADFCGFEPNKKMQGGPI